MAVGKDDPTISGNARNTINYTLSAPLLTWRLMMPPCFDYVDYDIDKQQNNNR